MCICFCNAQLYWKDHLCFCATPAKNSRLITWFASNLTLWGHWWQISSWEALAAATHILLKGHLGPVPISSQNSTQHPFTMDKAILLAAIYLTYQIILGCININSRKLINSVWFLGVFSNNDNIFYSVPRDKKLSRLDCLHQTHIQTHTYAWSQAYKETWKQSCKVSSKTSKM